MAFELEALVGHLYVAGRRTINTTPPGALIEVAPRRAARGRETDTFFVLVLPSGSIAPTSFYEQMAAMSAERYFSTTGSVTSALREMFNALNNNLYEHNRSGRRNYEANMVCAVLRSNELYIARVGSAVAVLRHDAKTVTYPDEVYREENLFQPALGINPMPQIEMKRFEVSSGSRLLLADASIIEITLERITQSIVAKSLETVLDDFKTFVTLQIQLMAVEFIPPETPVKKDDTIGESSSQITKEIAEARRTAQQQELEEAEEKKKQRENTPKRPNPIQQIFHQILQVGSRTIGQFLTVLGDVLTIFLGTPASPEKRRFSTGTITAIVILFPLAIVLLVVLTWAGGVGETAYEECANRVFDASDVARSIDSNNPTSVQAAWQGTLLIIEECEELRSEDPTMLEIRREGQRIIDSVNNVARRQTSTIATLPSATLSSIVLQGLDVYALDNTNDLVYRVQLTTDGLSSAGNPQPLANMRRGATVDGLQVGNIIDIAFDDQLNNIVAVDSSGTLVRCPPRFVMECDAQRLPGVENWVNPVRMTIWRGALYILDTGAGQLWRYTPSGNTYASAPTEYFVGASRPNLSTAVDFDITRTGTGVVYVLFAEGVMNAYLGGDPQPFSFVAFPVGQELNNTTVQSMYMNDTPVLPAFYIASQPTRTVYQTTLAGTYQNSYRIFDEAFFELLADIAVEPAQQIVYAVSGNSIFAFRMEG